MLRVDGVSKTYLPPPFLLRPLIRAAVNGPVEALRDVSLDVASGEVVGLVGPNGAGKTTLMKIIGSVLQPSAGTASVDGHDVAAEPRAAKRRLGLVLSEDRSAYWRITGRANLEFFGRLYGMSKHDARARANELLEQVGLAQSDKRVFGYSAGMRSRLNLARAMLSRPSALVLDEPTRSLDPLASVETIGLLRQVADDGCAVLFSSHRLDEVAKVCDRVIVLVSGRVRFHGTPGELDRDSSGVASRLVELLRAEAEAPVE
jgi:ABC-2 type transport system ATP-binding protein